MPPSFRLLLLLLFAAPSVLAQDLVPAGLRAEYREDPLGLDVAAPRLSWVLTPADPSARGVRQTAYQVLAASTPERLRAGEADVWDSGRVASEATLHVSYGGRPLASGERVYWAVRVWDAAGRASAYSAPAWWEMALLRPEAWRAQWIQRAAPVPQTREAFYDVHPNPLLRKAFAVARKPLARARVYVTGLGYYELHLNGARVGDHVLDPGWTDYDTRVLYSVYDVTRQLQEGDNVLGVLLGNGWYNPLPLPIFRTINLRETLPTGPPKLRLQLRLEYADGTTEEVVSDTTWKTADGPILKHNVYLGEVYDARREPHGWDAPGFDDAGWAAAVPAEPPAGRLQAQDAPPIRVHETLRPVAVTEPDPGVFIFDLGQNFAGWVTLRLAVPRGTRLDLRYGEVLRADGRLNVLTSVAGQIKEWDAINRGDWARVDSGAWWADGPYPPETAWQGDTYLASGAGLAGGAETYTPRFTWHGFRYVEVRGYPGRPPLDLVEGHALYSDVPQVGAFASSNHLFDRIQHATRWALRSNLFSVQSDCPHRERYGYGGDIVATSEMAMLHHDMARFYAKAVRDFADAQRPSGGFTEIAPHVGIADEGFGDGTGPVGWGTAHPMLVWQLYQYYGDRQIVEEQYDPVRRWVDFLATEADGYLLDNGISDHESLTPKPKAVTGTAFFYYNATLLARMARLLGRADDAARYDALAAQVAAAFARRFVDPRTGAVGPATQAAQAFGLYFGLVPEAQRPAALALLVDSVAARGHHFTTGIFGTKYALNVLTGAGRADVAYAAADQRTFPGWGYMVEHGATTLWETWKRDETVYSHNHPMFGSVSEWFVKALAGLAPADDAAGFDRAVVHPRVVDGLSWARGYYDSVRGRLATSWRRSGDTLTLEVTIPVSMTATVHVPALHAADVREGGRPAAEAEGLTFLRMEAGAAVYRAENGRYRFTSRLR